MVLKVLPDRRVTIFPVDVVVNDVVYCETVGLITCNKMYFKIVITYA
jgi:hypothetical protein